MVVYKQLFTSLPTLRSKTELVVLKSYDEALIEHVQKIGHSGGSLTEQEKEEHCLHIPDTNTAVILLTCRKICEEATLEFYTIQQDTPLDRHLESTNHSFCAFPPTVSTIFEHQFSSPRLS